MPPESEPPVEPPRSLYRRLRAAFARRFPRLQQAYRWWLGWLHAKRQARKVRRESLEPGQLRRTALWLAATVGELRRRRGVRGLTVAVDVTPFWEPLTGIGWYLYLLLRHLADRPDVHIRMYGPTVVATPNDVPPATELPKGSALELVRYTVPDDLMVNAGLLIRWLLRAERLLIALDANDVLFAPNFFLPTRFGLARGALVATIHDLGVRKVPWTLRARTRRQLTARLEETLFQAARVITVSAAVRDELAGYGYADRDRVRVVHHGAGQLEDAEAEPPPAGLPARYALHVGTLEPRKNIGGLLATWRELGALMADPPTLLLCGGYGWQTDGIRRQVEAAAAAGTARHLGYVSAGQLAALYRDAQVVLFPSLYEGFGLPAIEALQAGAPLVCSDIPALREVAGDAALYAPPDRPDLLARQVERALCDADERRRLAAAARRRLAEFSWPEAARRTLEVWRQAAATVQ